MVDKDRQLIQIKDDIKIISSNKLSMSQSKLLFMGITFEIILRKDLFPKNSNLKAFINNLYLKYFIDKEPFKEYIYVSRTILGARVQRKIKSDLNYNQIIQIVNELYNMLPNDDINKNKGNKKNGNKDISEWMNFIGEKDR